MRVTDSSHIFNSCFTEGSGYIYNGLPGKEIEMDEFEKLNRIVPEPADMIKETDLPVELPLLPLRNAVVFPMTQIPLTVGRPRSVAAVKAAESLNQLIGITAQKDPEIEEPTLEDLYQIGVLSKITKVIQYPDGNYQVIVQGVKRFRIDEIISMDPYIKVRVTYLKDRGDPNSIEISALVTTIKQLAIETIKLSPQIPDDARYVIENISEPNFLLGVIAGNLPLTIEEKQELLAIDDLAERLKKLLYHLNRNLQILELSTKIQNEVKDSMDKTQKEYFLREQLKIIKKELGEEGVEEEEELREKIEKAGMPESVKAVALKELSRLSKMNIHSPEYSMVRTYLDWLIELPWNKSTKDRLNIKKAREILDQDHYNLEKVKKRILEYLSVLKLKRDLKGPILCLVGPPGVGKTSLGKSIARALGRKFVRISLGGIRDEAEIRGHRRTYIGALPGRIIQGIKKAGTNNPVFMLDEIDKLGADFRGDPAAALLEVLDPEQNNSFSDHYLEVPFDLSKVLFIATANVTDTIPPALLDRMEVIEIPGYTQDDKLEIAKKFLIPKQIRAHGLKEKYIKFTDETINLIIDAYTREAGVRNLERQIAAICRNIAMKVAEGDKSTHIITPDKVREILGPEIYYSDVAERTSVPGVTVGLAWTPFGGDILFIEATKMKGKGNLILTGHLGEVMKESAQAALSYLRSNAEEYGINPEIFGEVDIHLHIPAGAIPKDGPSAGVAILTALTSLFLEKPVKPVIAMTGEITLRGMILPVGGIREKVLAAKRAGIKRIILPEKNRKDLTEIPQNQLEGLKFHFVKRNDEVLKIALGIRRKKGKQQ